MLFRSQFAAAQRSGPRPCPNLPLIQPEVRHCFMKGAMDWILSKRVTDQQGKDKTYWIDEIAFLEARLNGSQGDIDNEDRAACEEALKAAKANLAASR